MIKLTKRNFEQVVENSQKPVVVIFAGEWCPDCNAIYPYFQHLEETYGEEITFARAHVTKEKEFWPRKFDFQYIPTFIFFKDGTIWKKFRDEGDIERIEEVIKQVIDRE
ncbi:MAG: thioredoxin [Candidatus Korarchaeota archaeon]|nr:thioredoxin [Candidatus Korarchaeota archaeon]NIU82327.1 thioredoxin fold domain-containing protein [Candidatus Thorarchaeota archaeon]NIW12811.1 thioredoxin fold domain-containing protein [Candidatus Thorarchaeota archaeon]NIW51008.1 thioredoxin fold domain-containing protein [Candidatus Korarchaeota archaeon]